MVISGVALFPWLAGCTSAAGSLHRTQPAFVSQAESAYSMGTVRAVKVTDVGNVLVNAGGLTLYVFAPDNRSEVTCTGKCAHYWVPLELSDGQPIAGPGINAKLLRTIKGPGGSTYVTYNKWPLYTLVGDSGPGTADGQSMYAFGGYWWVLSPSGNVVKSARASTGATRSHVAQQRR